MAKKNFGFYLKESSKAYFSGMLKGFKDSLKVMVPVSAGIIILGAIALKAAEDPDEDPDSNEEVPVEEPNEEESSDSKMDENLNEVEKTIMFE